MKARHAVVTGRVQGVGFRWSTRDAARRFGCVGWVRNLADGTVEAHLQGPDQAVEALETWLHSGPPAARVDRVAARDATVDTSLASFVVR